MEQDDGAFGAVPPRAPVLVAGEHRAHLVGQAPELLRRELEPLVEALGGGSPAPVPVIRLGIPAAQPAGVLGNQLAPEGAVRLDQPGVIGVDGPFHALVAGPPIALAAAAALDVVLDEAVLLELAQVVARRAARLTESPSQLRCRRGPVLAQ